MQAIHMWVVVGAGAAQGFARTLNKGRQMTPNAMTGTRLYTALFAATLLSACASEALGPAPVIQPQPGHAFLKIVGDKNVFLGYGGSRELIVKYVNDNDEGLAGEVEFEIKGTGNGARLTAA